MGYIAVTIPAVTVKGLWTHHDSLNGLFMAADAVGLNDSFGFIARPDGNRYISCCERINILDTLPSLFQVIHNLVLMRKVKVYKLGELLVRRVITVLVL